MNWITDRLREPSSWVAIGLITVGIGSLFNSPIIIIGGIVGGSIGFFVSEKGMI